MVKLILREKEYEVKPGMTLLSSLEKCGILSESVIATREGELILDDEILQNGEVIRLIAVISGGAGFGERELGIGSKSESKISNNEAHA